MNFDSDHGGPLRSIRVLLIAEPALRSLRTICLTFPVAGQGFRSRNQHEARLFANDRNVSIKEWAFWYLYVNKVSLGCVKAAEEDCRDIAGWKVECSLRLRFTGVGIDDQITISRDSVKIPDDFKQVEFEEAIVTLKKT